MSFGQPSSSVCLLSCASLLSFPLQLDGGVPQRSGQARGLVRVAAHLFAPAHPCPRSRASARSPRLVCFVCAEAENLYLSCSGVIVFGSQHDPDVVWVQNDTPASTQAAFVSPPPPFPCFYGSFQLLIWTIVCSPVVEQWVRSQNKESKNKTTKQPSFAGSSASRKRSEWVISVWIFFCHSLLRPS